MDSRKPIYYSVVQFLHKPHPDIGQYVIVPDSWIKARGDRISVLYPDKRESAKLDRFYAMDPNEKGNKIKWTPYLSELKHTAENYQDAKDFVKRACGQTKRRSSKFEPTMSNNGRKRRHDDNLEHSSSKSNVKNQQDINPFIGMVAKQICKEFLPAFLQRSLSRYNFDQFFHPNSHKDDSDDNDESATEPTNKRVSSEFRDDDSDSDYAESVKPTKRRVKLVLPPEYDENDSRWTLRHREPRPGLERLVPEFDVYIDTRELNDILNVSTTAIQLSRLLFLKIFSDNALATCSLTGMRANSYDTDTRPGLDAGGRDALLKFVRYWEEKKEWDPVNVMVMRANFRAVLTQRRRLQARISSEKQKKKVVTSHHGN